MKPKLCLPIIKISKTDVLRTIKENINDFDFFEVWIDHTTDWDNQFIKKLIDLLGRRLIIVLRRNDGNKIKNSLKKRCEIIRLLNDKASLLDLDIRNIKELKFIKQNRLNTRLITSFHDFQKTPGNKEIFSTIKAMSRNRPKIFKIATFCRNEKDAIRLLDILQTLKKEGKKCIVLGMGKLGIITRIFGSLWGNEMIFAPLSKIEQSAPGQLTKSQLLNIFKNLE